MYFVVHPLLQTLEIHTHKKKLEIILQRLTLFSGILLPTQRPVSRFSFTFKEVQAKKKKKNSYYKQKSLNHIDKGIYVRR